MTNAKEIPLGVIPPSYSFKNPHNIPHHETKNLDCKLSTIGMLESFPFQAMIVSLVVIDIILFFFELSTTISKALTTEALVITQFIIAMIFVTEIIVKLYVYSFHKFILATTNLVDTIIIVVSAIGAILELIHYVQTVEKAHKASALSGGSMFVRLIRLLRLFRLFRIYRIYGALKMSPTRNFEAALAMTPNAQVLDILTRVRRCLLVSGEFDEYVVPVEVEWVIDVVKNDRLGKAMVEMDQEEQKFIDEMGAKIGIVNASITNKSDSSISNFTNELRKRRNTTYSAPLQPSPFNSHKQVHEILLTADHLWNFDVFGLRDASDGHPLTMVGFHFFQAFGLLAELQIPEEVMIKFLAKIESGYDRSNPYHNNTHAADVTQTLCYILKEFGLLDDLTPLQVCAAVFGAVVHDYLHVGFTNKLLIATDHPLAIRYNDHSVLENHSIAMALDMVRSPRIALSEMLTATSNAASPAAPPPTSTSITSTTPDDLDDYQQSQPTQGLMSRGSGLIKWLKRGSSNKRDSGPDPADGGSSSNLLNSAKSEIKIFDRLSESEYRELRTLAVDMVLHTDMARHFELIARLEAHEHSAYDTSNPEDVKLLLQAVLHMADISNPSKSWTIYSRWIDGVMTEFRRQGKFEKEHGLPVSMFMDPDGGKDVERQCQSAFIDLFAMPFVQAFHRFICTIKPTKKQKSQEILDQLEANRAQFGGNLRTNRRRGSKAPPPPSPKHFASSHHKREASIQQSSSATALQTSQTNKDLESVSSSTHASDVTYPIVARGGAGGSLSVTVSAIVE